MRGGIEATRTWPVEPAWLAVTEVTASAYGVDLVLLRAPSRGRGPRPPERAREPKKVAIYLTVLLSGVDCAALGRMLGLHKDTVASHSAEVREWADDDVVEANLQALAAAASVKLGLSQSRSASKSDWSRRLASLKAHMAEAFAAAALSDETSDASSDAPEKSRSCDLGKAAA